MAVSLPPIPVTRVDVEAQIGPTGLTCRPCGRPMLPEDAGPGLSRWMCWCCYRSVEVHWDET